MLCVCVCSRQGTYLVSVCEYVLSLVGSAQLQCEVISLQNTTTQPTHTRTHTFTWTRNIPIFSSNPCQLPGRMAGMCVCEARLFRTCRPCKSLPGAGLHVEIPKRRGLGHASVLITRVHICRGCTQITPTRILMIICYQASLSLPTCHSNTHTLSPCIRWRPAWQEKKGASRGNPEAVRSITQQH